MLRMQTAPTFRKWWWVLTICLGSGAFHLSATHFKSESIAKLHASISQLSYDKSKALSLQEELRSRIDSQNDPEWIKMMLMRGLGLAPEGSVKVHFEEIPSE